MTTKQLREWLFQNSQDDQWWMSLDSVTEDCPVTVNEIEERLRSGEYSQTLVLHVSHAEMAHPTWIEVTHPFADKSQTPPAFNQQTVQQPLSSSLKMAENIAKKSIISELKKNHTRTRSVVIISSIIAISIVIIIALFYPGKTKQVHAADGKVKTKEELVIDLVRRYVQCISVQERLPLVLDRSMTEEMEKYYKKSGPDKWKKRCEVLKSEIMPSEEWQIPPKYTLVKATRTGFNFYGTQSMAVSYYYIKESSDGFKIDWVATAGYMEDINTHPKPTVPKLARIKEIIPIDKSNDETEEKKYYMDTYSTLSMIGIVRKDSPIFEKIEEIAQNEDNIAGDGLGCTLILKWRKKELVGGVDLNGLNNDFDIVEFVAPHWAPTEIENN